MIRRRDLLAGTLVAAAVPATAAAADWTPFRYFIGKWTKREEGAPGIGGGERSYEFILQNKFLLWRNRSTFEPQPQNPEGEVHEDWGIVSYDEGRGKFLLRQFFSEGYVHHYVLDETGGDGKRFVFSSEMIENTPPGFRSRLSVEIRTENEFDETFELARPGAEFKTLITNHLKRR